MAPRPGGVPPPPTPPSKTHLHLHHPPPRHKRVNHPNRIVTAHNFVQNLRKKRRLVSRLSRHVRHHRLESSQTQNTITHRVFTQPVSPGRQFHPKISSHPKSSTASITRSRLFHQITGGMLM